MLKWPLVSPTQPRRAKTRRSASKAAIPYLVSRKRTMLHGVRFTHLSDARTPLADFFSMLLCRLPVAGFNSEQFAHLVTGMLGANERLSDQHCMDTGLD